MKVRAACLATALLVSSAISVAAPSGKAPAAAPVAPVAPVPLEIVVYDQADFKGTSQRFGKPVPDLAPFKFDNKVASLQIFGAGDWVLCENKNYQGRCARVAMQAVNLKLQNLNDRVSSLYPVPAPAPAPASPRK
jgi:hypothetical protein